MVNEMADWITSELWGKDITASSEHLACLLGVHPSIGGVWGHGQRGQLYATLLVLGVQQLSSARGAQRGIHFCSVT
jgi:hypothetical protein